MRFPALILLVFFLAGCGGTAAVAPTRAEAPAAPAPQPDAALVTERHFETLANCNSVDDCLGGIRVVETDIAEFGPILLRRCGGLPARFTTAVATWDSAVHYFLAVLPNPGVFVTAERLLVPAMRAGCSS